MEKKNLRNLLLGVSAVAGILVMGQGSVQAGFDCCEVFKTDDLETSIKGNSASLVKTIATGGGPGNFCTKSCGNKTAWVSCDNGWFKKASVSKLGTCEEPANEAAGGSSDSGSESGGEDADSRSRCQKGKSGKLCRKAVKACATNAAPATCQTAYEACKGTDASTVNACRAAAVAG